MSTSAPAEPPAGGSGQPIRPVPVPDERSAGFWEAAGRHELAVQQCGKCGWFSYPPDVVCARCLSPERAFHWTRVSGRATLRTWTVVRTAFLPGFGPYVPYVVAAVELDEQAGLRLTARLITDAPGDLRAGARTETAFEDVAEGRAVPVFKLVPA